MARKNVKKKVEDLIAQIAKCYAFEKDPVICHLAEEAYMRGELLLLACDIQDESLFEISSNSFSNAYIRLLDYDEIN